MRTARIILALAAMHLKSRLAYRADFLAELASSTLSAVFSTAFVWLLFEHPQVPDVAGWTREQVLFIYGFSLVSMGIFNLYSENLHEFGDRYVIRGQLDRVLLRPVPGIVQVLSESFSLDALGEIATGFALVAYGSRELGLAWTASDVAAFALMAISSAAVFTGVFLSLACASFWFEDRLGLAPPFWNMINFGRYPVNLYRPWLRLILSWVVPFAFIGFYPASGFLLGGEDFAPFRAYWWLTPVVGMAALAVACALWRAGTRRYASTGS